MTKKEFCEAIKELGIKITPEMLKKLETYCEFLLEYNNHTNLTAIRNEEEVYLKHFYDSLTITKIIDLNKEKTLLDIGSGAGFPGMVLKIIFPHLKITLVDSNNKKTKFLELLKLKLNVDNIEIINNRIENITPTKINSYDIVTARAVTNMAVLTELAMPLVNEGKYFIAMKGSNQGEIEAGKYVISKMHGKIVDTIKFNLTSDNDFRTLIKVVKLKKTKIDELRPYDKIIKKPLVK